MSQAGLPAPPPADGSAARAIRLVARYPEASILIVVGTLALSAYALWYYAPFSRFVETAVADPAPPGLDLEDGPSTFAFGAIRPVAHDARGSMRMIARTDGSRMLRLEDLRVPNGPALFVYLSSAGPTASPGSYDDADSFSLGPLKGNAGNLNYDIPDVLNLSRFRTVVIWSERFDVAYAVAPIVF